MNRDHLTARHLWSITALFALTLLSAIAAPDPALDWPGWRGPTGDGIAAPGQNPPTIWSESSNVLWKISIPGRGHSSPTIVADRIYLATADQSKGSQSILCFDRQTGKSLWQTEVHHEGGDPGHHANSSAASSTPACDGQNIFINFLNNGAVFTTSLTLDGKITWQQKICDYVTHQGFGSSSILYESIVLVSADNRGGGVVAGLDRKTGKIIWTQPRPKIANYTSPAVIKAAGKSQVVLAGCNLWSSFDPLTGKKLWEIPGSTEECVGTVVTDGTRVFAGGGWPKNHLAAIAADGSGAIVWQNGTRVYVPSLIAKSGHLYGVLDSGIAVCWKSDTGEELWKERLGGDFFASPVMVNNRIYASNLNGTTYVFEATPTTFKLLAKNQLTEEQYASPVICANRLYLRAAQKAPARQEYLYCIAEPNELRR